MKIVCLLANNNCTISSSLGLIPELTAIDNVLPSVIVLKGKTSLIFSKNNQAFVFYFIEQKTGGYAYEVKSLTESRSYVE